MSNSAEQHHPTVVFPLLRRVEFQLLAWVAACVFVTLALFETADVLHDTRALSRLGADVSTIAEARRDSIRLHAIHGAATILVLVISIHLVTRRFITRRVTRMLESIQRVRTGAWTLPYEETPADELGSVAEARRQLGPHLERKLHTVARLGIAYEASLAPSARRIVALAEESRAHRLADPVWEEIRQSALHIRADMGRLGRPEHPAVASIVEGASLLRRTAPTRPV